MHVEMALGSRGIYSGSFSKYRATSLQEQELAQLHKYTMLMGQGAWECFECE